MAWPLIGLAAAGALKGIGGARAAGRQAEQAWQQAEDERKRRQKQFELSGIREEHGAEGRKTLGDIWGKGFLSNFGVDPSTGVARNPQFAAMLADPWRYRSRDQLLRLSPHRDPIPKPKGPGFGGYLGAALGGAAEGAGAYYGAGGTFGLPRADPTAPAAAPPTAAPDFGGPALPTTPVASDFTFSPVGPGGGGSFAPVGPATARRFTSPRIY